MPRPEDEEFIVEFDEFGRIKNAKNKIPLRFKLSQFEKRVREKFKWLKPTAYMILTEKGVNPFTVFKEFLPLFELIKKKYGLNKVYMPGMQTDITPALVFDETILLEIDKLSIANLKQVFGNKKALESLKEIIKRYTDYDIHKVIIKHGDATKFKPPKDTNLLVLLNITCKIDPILNRMPKGSYIVCNEYFENAQHLLKEPNKYEFLGQVTENGVKEQTYDEFVNARKINVDFLWLFKKI